MIEVIRKGICKGCRYVKLENNIVMFFDEKSRKDEIINCVHRWACERVYEIGYQDASSAAEEAK